VGDHAHATLATWVSSGFQFERWNEGAGDSPDLPCNLAGSINGLRVGAQVSTAGEVRVNALAISK